MKTILAPVDFSPATSAVVAHACSLARVFSGRIVILTAIQPPIVMTEYAAFLATTGEIVTAGKKAAAKRLAKLRNEIASEFITVETELSTDLPIEAITDAARKFAADYIVMGSHGHTALYDLFVGSTTHGVLKRARCPVVVIPAEKAPSTKRRR